MIKTRALVPACLCALALSAVLLLPTAAVQAQDVTPTPTPTPTPVPTPTPTPGVRTTHGHWEANTGDYGGYTHTVTPNTTGGGSTVQTVYTRHGDGATRTEITTVSAEDSQGGYTLTTSVTDFGASGTDTTTATVAKARHGQFIATGTYSSAAGDTGALSGIIGNIDHGHAVSELHTSDADGSVTLLLRTERQSGGSTEEKILNLNPDGTLGQVVIERFPPSTVTD